MEKERERERDRDKGKEGGKEERKCPRLEVYLPDAVPKAFEMVLSYIYTDRIYPAGVNGACLVTVEARTSFHPLCIRVVFLQATVRVPTRTGKPGKMGRHFPVREKSGNFDETGKVREKSGKIT